MHQAETAESSVLCVQCGTRNATDPFDDASRSTRDFAAQVARSTNDQTTLRRSVDFHLSTQSAVQTLANLLVSLPSSVLHQVLFVLNVFYCYLHVLFIVWYLWDVMNLAGPYLQARSWTLIPLSGTFFCIDTSTEHTRLTMPVLLVFWSANVFTPSRSMG